MKQVKLFFAATSLALCCVITNSCSQTTTSSNPTGDAVFIASTPCDDVSKTMLGIPSGTKCELMKWKLTLYQDPKTSVPSAYELTCMYGLPKQGTKDFMEGVGKIELKGKLTIGKGTNESAEAVVYRLNADNSPISLSFLRTDQNILHLLDGHKRLMIGNGAWSDTLNRIDPITTSPAKLGFQAGTSQLITSDSSTVGIFDGRTACNSLLRELNGISAAGCQATKWRLTLYQDPKTHMPTTFQIQTIFVGKGDGRYTNTGKWIVTKGTNTDPGSIVYHLELDSDKIPGSLTFQKADDNILFFLDKNRNLMVGDIVFSFTLNRVKK